MTKDKITETVAEPKKEQWIVKSDMSIQEFFTEMTHLNNTGREFTLKHQELFGKSKEDKLKGGRRYHAAGTQYECPYCKPIIDNFNDFMKLQAEQIGMTGIDQQGLMSAIKVTRATILMMKKGGEI